MRLFTSVTIHTDHFRGRKCKWFATEVDSLRFIRSKVRTIKKIYGRLPINPCRIKIVRCRRDFKFVPFNRRALGRMLRPKRIKTVI